MHAAILNRLLATTDGSEPADHAVALIQRLTASVKRQLEVLRVGSGIPGIEIVRRARESRADLVVLGRDARSPHRPLPLGRTSDAVVRRLDGLCLLVPPTSYQLKRMVVALDGTLRGLGVLEPAARFADSFSMDVIAVHVLPEEAGAALDADVRCEPSVERVREALAAYPELGGSGSLRAVRGSPVWKILDLLESFRADLLILGVRGGGPRGDMGSGHIGRDLLRTAPVAVLTVPI